MKIQLIIKCIVFAAYYRRSCDDMTLAHRDR